MQLVVMSDSHGSLDALDSVVKSSPDAWGYIHLGDGAREFEALNARYPQARMWFVSGNCDWASDAKAEGLLIFMGRRIFFTHGQTLGVKSGLERLRRRARELGADVACFGHTHIPLSTVSDGLFLFNPGSVFRPRRGGPSYGVIGFNSGELTLNIMYL